ncbi:phage protein Gp36 family protein [Citrobacter freundii]
MTLMQKLIPFLAKRYQLPLNLPSLPSPLRRAAVSIAFYWLSERDHQIHR